MLIHFVSQYGKFRSIWTIREASSGFSRLEVLERASHDGWLGFYGLTLLTATGGRIQRIEGCSLSGVVRLSGRTEQGFLFCMPNIRHDEWDCHRTAYTLTPPVQHHPWPF